MSFFGLVLVLFWITRSTFGTSVANVCNITSRTCCIWNNTDISEILDSIDASGWTLLVDACGRNEPSTLASTPLPCLTQPVPVSIVGAYITTSNTAVRSMQWASGTSALVTLTASDYTSINTYPCTSFIVQAPNVSIEFFTFDIYGCVSIMSQIRAIGGLASIDIWMYATPIIAIDRSNDLSLMHMTQLSLTNGGDAVVRILPYKSADTVNIDGAQFYNVTGRLNTSSPINYSGAAAFGVITGPASGNVVAYDTKAISFGGSVTGMPVLGPWLGIQIGVSPPSCKASNCPSCPNCKPPHPDTASTTALIILGVLFSSSIPIYCVYLILGRIHKLETQKPKTT
jgi:hypothetical protein